MQNQDDPDQGKKVVLVKRLELGLNLALRSKSSTAQISYSSTGDKQTVVFILKQGKLWASLAEGGFRYSLEPCYASQECHLWVKTSKKQHKYNKTNKKLSE